jgi:Holliday junction resolvase RusA-like endonuclease
MSHFQITTDIQPCSYYQYLTQNRFRKYITHRGREYKNSIETELVESMKEKEIFKGDVKVSIDFYFNNRRCNDIDNFAKPILDCMSEIVFNDDRQITDLHCKKFYDKENPRIVISCSRVSSDNS